MVIGNHEINAVGELEINGFDEIHSTLYAAGDPALLLTHMPLRNVPRPDLSRIATDARGRWPQRVATFASSTRAPRSTFTSA